MMASLPHNHFLNFSPLLFQFSKRNIELSIMQYLYSELAHHTHMLVSSSFSLFEIDEGLFGL